MLSKSLRESVDLVEQPYFMFRLEFCHREIKDEIRK